MIYFNQNQALSIKKSLIKFKALRKHEIHQWKWTFEHFQASDSFWGNLCRHFWGKIIFFQVTSTAALFHFLLTNNLSVSLKIQWNAVVLIPFGLYCHWWWVNFSFIIVKIVRFRISYHQRFIFIVTIYDIVSN